MQGCISGLISCAVHVHVSNMREQLRLLVEPSKNSQRVSESTTTSIAFSPIYLHAYNITCSLRTHSTLITLSPLLGTCLPSSPLTELYKNITLHGRLKYQFISTWSYNTKWPSTHCLPFTGQDIRQPRCICEANRPAIVQNFMLQLKFEGEVEFQATYSLVSWVLAGLLDRGQWN